MDAAERALLEATVQDAIAGAGAGVVDDVLEQLGWLEMLDAEPRDAIDVVFTTLGRTNAVATVLDDVLLAALGGETGVALVLPPFATWEPPGRIEQDEMVVAGLTTGRVSVADALVVVCRNGTELQRVLVPVADADVVAVRGIDPDAGLHLVRFEGAVSDAAPLDPTAWEAAIAAGRRAVAHQLSGACRTMLDRARAHALDRVQFGRPIAGFQAVRHRLAEALVAIEALDATLTAAWDEPGPMTAALAKASAGRTARTVAKHCQQVLAGVGFTTDHAFHRYLKRTLALGGLFGSTDDLVVDLGRQLIADRRVPTLIEL